PEGGDCITGIKNKVAFKATLYDGRPCNIKGTVVNSKAETVAEIKCIHDGMGFFYVEPEMNEAYTAKWKDEQGNSYQTPLPAIKHGKNTLVINLPDTIETNLSVAVTDADVGIDSSDNIITRFLLTGDLKGSVYNPAYYFLDSSDSVQQQLDLVMLTNGWRRIKW